MRKAIRYLIDRMREGFHYFLTRGGNEKVYAFRIVLLYLRIGRMFPDAQKRFAM